MLKDVFVYHLDNELQKLFDLNRYQSCYLYSNFRLATRIAYLVCKEKILLPASNYFESDLSFTILNELSELNEIGAIEFISSSHSITELLNKKAGQHGNNISLPNYHYNDFLDKEQKIILPATLRKRERSASTDIKHGWIASIDDPRLKARLYELTNESVSASQLEDLLYEVPRKLGSKAFISDYILPLLPIKNGNTSSANYILNVIVTREYINSFLNEFDAVCLKDIPVIDSNTILPQKLDKDRFISYNEIANKLKLLNYKSKNAFDYIKTCSTYELIEFKNSLEWESIIELLETTTKKENSNLERINDLNNKNNDNVKIGIITALPKECAAMKMMLKNVRECFFDDKGAGHRFFLGEISSVNGKTHTIALSQCGMGNNKAAIRATNMLMHFKSIESIIMTGIAGGIPSYQTDDKSVRLGDIVISEGIVQYDFVKETIHEIKSRSNMAKPSAALLEAKSILDTYEYENNYPWHKYIDDFSANEKFKKPSIETDLLFDLEGNSCEHPYDGKRTNYPRVFSGTIASANNLQKNPYARQQLKDNYGALAVEMEASGIADATWENEVGYLVVRGICDYCDSHKNDLWQEYAALVAAAYTRSLIELLPAF